MKKILISLLAALVGTATFSQSTNPLNYSGKMNLSTKPRSTSPKDALMQLLGGY